MENFSSERPRYTCKLNDSKLVGGARQQLMFSHKSTCAYCPDETTHHIHTANMCANVCTEHSMRDATGKLWLRNSQFETHVFPHAYGRKPQPILSANERNRAEPADPKTSFAMSVQFHLNGIPRLREKAAYIDDPKLDRKTLESLIMRAENVLAELKQFTTRNIASVSYDRMRVAGHSNTQGSYRTR